ncbi:nicotinamide riboside transporter PnuC [Paraburkholderia xenovorans]|uniref:nicotinamide riboside transporter PnuC n=1 Tax=Paraburkholderia xenovorans TaxID=36873 RepID=UPI0038BC7342
MSVLEIIGVIVSALAIWLTARRKMLCWPVGLVSVALYGWIFYDAKLYSDMLLQGAFAVLQVYGWWRWLAQQRNDEAPASGGEVRVRVVPLIGLLPGLLAAAVGSVALGWLMARLTDAALPFVDASLTSFSLVAQYWTARRYIASWWLWTAVNVVYVGMFVFKGLYPTSGLYAFFIVLAVIGWRDWSKALENDAPTPDTGDHDTAARAA